MWPVKQRYDGQIVGCDCCDLHVTYALLVNEIWHCRRRRYCCSNRKWVLLRKKSDSNTICMSRTHSIWQIASISDPDRDRKRRTNLAVTLFDFSSLQRYAYSDSNLNSPFKTVKKQSFWRSDEVVTTYKKLIGLYWKLQFYPFHV